MGVLESQYRFKRKDQYRQISIQTEASVRVRVRDGAEGCTMCFRASSLAMLLLILPAGFEREDVVCKCQCQG